MKKLLAVISLIVCSVSFASVNTIDYRPATQCLENARLNLSANLNHNVTHIVRLEGSMTLEPGEDTMMLEGDVWNASNKAVEVYIFRLNTAGISHRMQVKMSLPACRVISIIDHGRPL